MQCQETATEKDTDPSYESSLIAAERVIELLHSEENLKEEQFTLLASAYYTLSQQKEISLKRSKMYLNSTIAILQNIQRQDHDLASNLPSWRIQLANAFFRRAEIFEQEYVFAAATADYERAIQVLKPEQNLSDDNQLLISQCAISIADLLVHEQFDFSHLDHGHPLYYINKALEYLSSLPKGEELWSTLSYAHQIAGLALSSLDIRDAVEAFRTALTIAFKAEPKAACSILGDVYNSMGFLYENYFAKTAIQKVPACFKEHASIYYSIALLFNAYELNNQEEVEDLLDSLFDTVYRALDPYLSPLEPTVLRDFIDALIFSYYCISDKSLPNVLLCERLQESDLANTYAQHVYWLITESHRREHPNGRLLELANPELVDTTPIFTDAVHSILNSHPHSPFTPALSYNNIRYLPQLVV